MWHLPSGAALSTDRRGHGASDSRDLGAGEQGRLRLLPSFRWFGGDSVQFQLPTGGIPLNSCP